MNDLKRLEGKTIKDIKESSDGKNSFIIINFKEGGKLNITAYPNGDKGVGQLDVDFGSLSEEELQGKRIHTIQEEFDGVNDFINIALKDGNEIKISAFCSSEDVTAGIDTFVYSSDTLVSESLHENMFMNQRNGDYVLANAQYENSETDVVEILVLYKSRTSVDSLLDQFFDGVELLPGVNANGIRRIIIKDPKASVDKVNDVLHQYVKKGIIYNVEEIK